MKMTFFHPTQMIETFVYDIDAVALSKCVVGGGAINIHVI